MVTTSPSASDSASGVRGRTIGELLALLVLAIMLPLLTFSALILWSYTEQQRATLDTSALIEATELARAVERDIQSVIATLAGLATSPALQTDDLKTFEIQARRVAQLIDMPILLRDAATGVQVVNTRLPPAAVLPSAPSKDNVSRVVATKAPFVSDFTIGQITRKPLVWIGVPVVRDDQITSVLFASMDTERLSGLLSWRISLMPWRTAIVDRNGIVIAGQGNSHEVRGQRSTLDVTSGTPGYGVERTQNITGEYVLRGHYRTSFGWTAVVALPAARIDAPIRQSWIAFTAIGACLLGVALPFAAMLAQRIKAAMARAALRASALERGEVVPALTTGVVEVDALTRSLNATSLTLRERTRSLAESASRFRAAFDQAAVGFVQQDLAGQWLDVNDRFCSLLGMTRLECLAVSPADVTHADDRAVEAARLDGVLRGSTNSVSYEKRLIASDSSIIWVRATTSLVHSADGHPIYFMTLVEDMTAEQRTAAERTKLAALVDASRDAMLSITHGNIIEACNPGTARLMGADRETIVGQSFVSLFGGKANTILAPILASAWSGASQTQDFSLERADGNALDVAISVSPVLSSSGSVNALAVTLEDIRQRRRWEKQLLLLNRELHHRIKNTLAVVQSIARQTLRSTPSLTGFRTAFEGRLQALAGANDLLLESRWTGEQLDTIVARQVAPMLANPADQIRASGDRVMIPADLVVPISLTLHELATNALKHGALTQPGGRIEVSWRTSNTDGRRELELNWTEHCGAPAPVSTPTPEKRRRGFGSLLIMRGIPGASVTHELTGKGLVCVIRVALAAAPYDRINP